MNEGNRQTEDSDAHFRSVPGRTALTDSELEHALRLMRRLGSSGDESRAQMDFVLRLECINRARRELASRRRRIGIFGNTMFGEAGWEVLLALYGELNGRRQTIAGICRAVGTAPTTTLRWIDYLEGQKLIQRQTHPTDNRAHLVDLTEKAVQALDLYFSQTPNDKE